ncbi:MAG: tetratricopeptide repeat protein, partial [bacterium]
MRFTRPPVSCWPLLMPALLLVTGCAYFNTFHNARTYYREGVQLSEQRQVGQARAKFEKSIEKSALVLSRWPNSRWADDATFLIGRSYYEMGQYGRAVRHFDQLVLAFPESPLVPTARYYRGLAMLRDREYGPARVLLDQVRRDHPELQDGAAFHLAGSFYDREDWERAADSLSAFVEQHPKSTHRVEALRRLARSCERLGRWEDCEASYRRLAVLATDPKERAEARLRIAGALLAQDRHEEAVPIVREVLGRYPELDDEAHILLGRSFAATGQTDQALETWLKVQGASDLGAEARFRIGRFYEERREFELARAHYDTARARRGNSEHGLLATKRLALLDAIAQTDSAGERDPAEVVFLLAEVHNLNLGEHDEARRLYQAVADSFPETDWAPKALLARAWITVYVKDDSVGSVPELQHIISRYPGTEYANEAKRWLGLPAPPREKPAELASAPPAPAPPPPERPEPPPEKPPDPSGMEPGRTPPAEPAPPPEPPAPPERAWPAEEPVSPTVEPVPPEPVPKPPDAPRPAAPAPVPAVAGAAEFGPVHFDFDRADIRQA